MSAEIFSRVILSVIHKYLGRQNEFLRRLESRSSSHRANNFNLCLK